MSHEGRARTMVLGLSEARKRLLSPPGHEEVLCEDAAEGGHLQARVGPSADAGSAVSYLGLAASDPMRKQILVV